MRSRRMLFLRKKVKRWKSEKVEKWKGGKVKLGLDIVKKGCGATATQIIIFSVCFPVRVLNAYHKGMKEFLNFFSVHINRDICAIWEDSREGEGFNINIGLKGINIFYLMWIPAFVGIKNGLSCKKLYMSSLVLITKRIWDKGESYISDDDSWLNSHLSPN